MALPGGSDERLPARIPHEDRLEPARITRVARLLGQAYDGSMRRRLVFLLAGLVLAPLVAARGSGTEATPARAPATGNLFPNGSFESGREPWYSLKPPDFILSDARAHTGSHSALLQMRAGPEQAGAKVHYLLQEISPRGFPQYLSGWYRVENWKQGAAKQYMQFVVIAFDASNNPIAKVSNYQIRFSLAGIGDEPFAVGNAKFVFITKDEPVQGEWVHFQQDIKQAFVDQWGAAPESFSKLRILFEVRYDDKKAGEASAEADVYFDDLYVGPDPQ